MKKRILALFLCLTMIVGVLNVPIIAAELASNSTESTPNETSPIDLPAKETSSGESWGWDAETKTLTLNGLNLVTDATPAIKLPAGATIVLASGSVNTVTTTAASGRGIEAEGSLTIKTEDGAAQKATLNVTTGTNGRGIIYRPSAALETADDVNINISGVILNINGTQRSIEATLDVAVPEGAAPALTVTLTNAEYTDNATDRSVQAYNSKGNGTLNIESSTVKTTDMVYVYSKFNIVMNITGSTVEAQKIKLGWWDRRMDLAQLNVTDSTLVMTNINGSDAAIEVGVNGPTTSEAIFTNSKIVAVNDIAAAISVSEWMDTEERDNHADWTVAARGALTIDNCEMTIVGTKDYGDLGDATVTNSNITTVMCTDITKENDQLTVTGVTDITSGETYTADNATITVDAATGAVTVPAGTTLTKSDETTITPEADITVTPGHEIIVVTISTVDELKAFAAAVRAGDNFANKNVILTADIIFDEGDYWYSNDGTTVVDNRITKGFAGIFNGNGYSIKNLQFKQEKTNFNDHMYLFNSVSGTVKNLTLDGVTANINGEDHFGFIALNLTGTAKNCHVKNVTVNVALSKEGGRAYINYSGAMFGVISGASVIGCTGENINFNAPEGKDTTDIAGALIGQASGSGDVRSTIKDCHVTDVTFILSRKTKRLGGFIGYTSNTDVINCTATDVTITVGTYYQNVGGFVGTASTNSVYTDCKVTNFTFVGDSTDYAGDVGGFAAYVTSGSTTPVAFNNCDVTGLDMKLTCNDNYKWAAGGLFSYVECNTVIEGCDVTGDITVEGDCLKHESGGIIGTLDGASNKNITVDTTTANVAITTNGVANETVGGNSGGNNYTEDKVTNTGTITSPVVEIDGTRYATLEAAIAAATDGQTITLLKNLALDGAFATDKAITFDLNGKTFKANGFTLFEKTAVLKDSVGGGLIKVAKGNADLSSLNTTDTIVLYSETLGGYVVKTVKDQNQLTTNADDGTFELIFRPSFATDVAGNRELLGAGDLAADIEIVVRLVSDSFEQEFVYGDGLVEAVYSGDKAFKLAATGATTDHGTMTIQYIIESGTGMTCTITVGTFTSNVQPAAQ